MAFIGYGAELHYSDDNGTTWNLIDEQTSIQLPTYQTGSVETSHINMLVPVKEFMPGLSENTPLTFECNYSKAKYIELAAIKGLLKTDSQIPVAGDQIKWRVTGIDEDFDGVGTAPTWTFSGFLSKLELSPYEAESVLKLKGEVVVTGEVVMA